MLGQHRDAGASIRRPPLLKAYGILTGLLALISLLLLFVDAVIAYSVCLGGLLVVLPNAWFAWRFFRFSGSSQTVAVMHSLYHGEAGKFVLTLALFATVFMTVQPLRVGALFAAYVLTLLAHALLASRLQRRR